jgi:AcrR family transcriptional regulator
MGKTKQKILDQSRELFNELGYSQVTIRMIASELAMSSGNLNYHYPKREDILEALYFEMVEVFDKRVEELGEQAISLAFMKSSVEVSMERMIAYRFFWTDLYNLLKSNDRIRTHFEAVKEERINGFLFVFAFFVNQNILQKPSFPDEYRFLSERMIDYSNTWLYASSLYEHKQQDQEIIGDASFHLLSMMYPYLTNSGQREFQQLYSSFFPQQR